MKAARLGALALAAVVTCAVSLPPAFGTMGDGAREPLASARESAAAGSNAEDGQSLEGSGAKGSSADEPGAEVLGGRSSAERSEEASSADGGDAKSGGLSGEDPSKGGSAENSDSDDSASDPAISWGLDGVAVGALDGEEAASRVATGTDDVARLWTNSGDYADGGSLTLKAEENVPFKLLSWKAGDPAPTASDFTAAQNALKLQKKDLPRDVYALIERDCAFNDGTPEQVDLKKGDIVRLPRVCLDTEGPQLDGAASASGGRLFEDRLYAASLSLDVPAVDEEADGAPDDGSSETVSGLSEAWLMHKGEPLGDEAVLGDDKRGAATATFDLGIDISDAYAVEDLCVEVRDIAGNVASIPLSGALQGAGGAWDASQAPSVIEVVAQAPVVSVSYAPVDGGDLAAGYAARTATVTLSDPRCSELMSWYGSLSDEDKADVPPVVVFAGPSGSVPVTLEKFALSSDPGQKDVLVADVLLDESGGYSLANADESGPGFVGLVPGLSAVWGAGADLHPFVVDVDGPCLEGAMVIEPQAEPCEGTLYAQGDVRIEFRLSDAVSGIDPDSVAVEWGSESFNLEFSVDPDDPRAGTATWTVPGGKLVDFSQVKLSFKDKAGNSECVPDPSVASKGGTSVTAVYAHVPSPEIDLTFDNGAPLNGKYYKEARTATVTVKDVTFGQMAQCGENPVIAECMHKGNLDKQLKASNFENPSGDGITWQAQITCSLDGTHKITASFQNLAGQKEACESNEFVVDQKPPEAKSAVFRPGENVQWDCLFADGEVTATFTLKDETSGIDPSTAKLFLGGVEQAVESWPTPDGLGATVVWTIPADSVPRDLSQVSLAFADRAGNDGAVSDLAGSSLNKPDIDGVFADGADPVVAVEFDNNDVRNGSYYNAPRTATVTVTEASFDFVHENDPELVVATVYRDGESWREVRAGEFVESPEGSESWTADVLCEGDHVYRIEAGFTDPSGREAEPYRGEEFTVDTTAPSADEVRISPHATVQWGWLFAADGATVAFDASDNLAGIDGASAMLTANGASRPVSFAADDTDGTFTWDIPADDSAIALSDVSLSFADKAGNAASISSLLGHEERDLDVEGIFADSAAPVISVEFDNNDVRNGKYYNAPRTATVTVTEASFGFVRENDPYRTVVTRHFDDSSLTVAAEKFENPSGDGVTWVAQVPCESDGVYRIEADFTDPSGKSAVPYRSEEFVVDTSAPLIVLSFDNNDAEGGAYFKAPRTATIAVHDDNFSADLAEVSVSAADASGAAVSAPGIDGWTEMPQGTWTTHVAFDQELHYSMSVACTDLAGNAAEVVEEPEFVIDLTAPSVRIERVEQHVAYKDRVAPLVTFEDTNFEPFLAEVSIVGASHGEERFFASEETLTDTSRVLDFSDFDYELDVDDVYTLTAKVSDRAGNQSEQSVTFSVNRFGSNYELSSSTAALVGSYVKRGESVSITETNVSGLESSLVSLAHNDKVSSLEAGVDYEVVQEGGQDTWSRYTYTLPAELFAQDGYYRVMLASRDAAGGLSENLMEGKNADRTAPLEISFAVDGTAPTAALGNVGNGSSHYAPRQRVDVLAGDNMEAQRAVLYVDGEQRAEWDAEGLAASRAFDFALPAADAPQTVRLEVTDRAGNTASTEVRGVVVTGDLLRYVLSTPSILYPLIAGLILIIAVLVGAAVALRRSLKKRRERLDALFGGGRRAA